MAVSGLPEYKVAHAKHISLLALEMMDLSRTVTVDDEPVVSGINIISFKKVIFKWDSVELNRIWMVINL